MCALRAYLYKHHTYVATKELLIYYDNKNQDKSTNRHHSNIGYCKKTAIRPMH